MNDLETARLLGETRYRGSPCGVCGETVRLTSNRHCLACHREKKAYAKREAAALRRASKPLTPRQRAAQSGKRTYLGQPCETCGGRRRYVSSHDCIACRKAMRPHRSTETKEAARIRKARSRKLVRAMASPMARLVLAVLQRSL